MLVPAHLVLCSPTNIQLFAASHREGIDSSLGSIFLRDLKTHYYSMGSSNRKTY